MIGPRPNFIDNPYFYFDDDADDGDGKWLYKEGAPEGLIKEYEEFYQEVEAQGRRG